MPSRIYFILMLKLIDLSKAKHRAIRERQGVSAPIPNLCSAFCNVASGLEHVQGVFLFALLLAAMETDAAAASAAPAAGAAPAATSSSAGGVSAAEHLVRLNRLRDILSGKTPIALHLDFLYRWVSIFARWNKAMVGNYD